MDTVPYRRRPAQASPYTLQQLLADWYLLGRQWRRRGVDLDLAIRDHVRHLDLEHPVVTTSVVGAFTLGWLSEVTA